MTKSEIVNMAYEAGCPNIIVPAEWFRFAKLVAAAEREKLKHELLTLEKWKGMALAKDGDGRTVQEVQREAREAEREACLWACTQVRLDDGEGQHQAWYAAIDACIFAIKERGAP